MSELAAAHEIICDRLDFAPQGPVFADEGADLSDRPMHGIQSRRDLFQLGQIDRLCRSRQLEGNEELVALEKIGKLLDRQGRMAQRILLPVRIVAGHDRYRMCKLDDLGPERLDGLHQWTETGAFRR